MKWKQELTEGYAICLRRLTNRKEDATGEGFREDSLRIDEGCKCESGRTPKRKKKSREQQGKLRGNLKI